MLQSSRQGFCFLSRFPFLMLPVIWTLHIIDQIISPLRFFRSFSPLRLHSAHSIACRQSRIINSNVNVTLRLSIISFFLQNFNDFFPVLHPFHWRRTGIDQKGNILFILSLNLNLFCHEQSPFVSYIYIIYVNICIILSICFWNTHQECSNISKYYRIILNKIKSY